MKPLPSPLLSFDKSSICLKGTYVPPTMGRISRNATTSSLASTTKLAGVVRVVSTSPSGTHLRRSRDEDEFHSGEDLGGGYAAAMVQKGHVSGGYCRSSSFMVCVRGTSGIYKSRDVYLEYMMFSRMLAL